MDERYVYFPDEKTPTLSGAGHGPRKKTPGWGAMLCCCLLSALLGAGTMAAMTGLWGHAPAAEPEDSPAAVSAEADSSARQVAYQATGEAMTPSEIYEAYVNSTVGITTAVTTNYFGRQTTSAAAGSGFILTADGYILTNYHVIENAKEITVSLYSGAAYPAQVVGYDETNDIAVLKVAATGLTPVRIGRSSDLSVGEGVVAIGNPLGELTFSLTAGVVSALDREITVSSGITMNLIQTDCAINSGNSGGALFDLRGEVVGITNAKYSGGNGVSIDNIAFAIPMDEVYELVTGIIQNGGLIKPYIGVSAEDVSTQMQWYGLPKGAVIRSVADGSPAQQAGLQAGDIVTGVNGAQTVSASALVRTIQAASAGDVLTLTVYRRGETKQLQVTVTKKLQTL